MNTTTSHVFRQTIFIFYIVTFFKQMHTYIQPSSSFVHSVLDYISYRRRLEFAPRVLIKERGLRVCCTMPALSVKHRGRAEGTGLGSHSANFGPLLSLCRSRSELSNNTLTLCYFICVIC